MDIVKFGMERVQHQFDTITADAKNMMVAYAPHKTYRTKGKGSMSKSVLWRTIKVEDVGAYKRRIGTSLEYAKYADKGRGAITTYEKPMKFIGADGRWHTTYHVSSMDGWEFASRTKKYIKDKYGGK